MSLNIKWQRLVVDGDTCERCGLTEEEVEESANKLKNSLKPLGIDVKLEKERILEEEFEQNPESSNAVFINGRPLEEWIGGKVGESECCDVCGDEDCRTMVVDGEEYEVVPSDLIVEGGLKAASEMRRNKCCDSSGKCCG